ncbi:MAG: extracellular solute-binding protein, partial [Treponema sp.]|nr:extracellular solute-binding protein [Treponema sp.]
MKIKKIDKILLCLTLIVLGAVFFKTIAGKLFPDNGEEESSTLVFSQWWEDELEPGALTDLIAEFEADNPLIKIRLDTHAYPELRDFLINLSGVEEGGEENSFPDIIALDPQWLYELLQGEILEPLTSYRRQGPFIIQSRPDMPEKQYEQWALPLISFMYPFFYNIAVLKNAGFDRPPKTRSEFLAYAQAVTNPAEGRYGTALSLRAEDSRAVYREIFPWFWAAGNFFFQEGEPHFTARAELETLGFFDQFRREGILSPGSFSKTEEQKREEFLTGKIAMMIGSIRDIDFLRERMGDESFGITTIPGPDGYIGKPAFGLSSWYAGISRRSAHKDEAWHFLAFLAERTSFLAAKAHAVPGDGSGRSGYIGANPF